MDEETQAWCEANGFTGHTVKSLVKEEFLTMQSIKAMTAEVISSLDLSMAQRCLLKKAVLTAQSAPSPPTTAGAGGAAASGQLARHRNLTNWNRPFSPSRRTRMATRTQKRLAKEEDNALG
ncbi:hypothetical protein ACROYT_G036798 [Oculina patagonica]